MRKSAKWTNVPLLKLKPQTYGHISGETTLQDSGRMEKKETVTDEEMGRQHQRINGLEFGASQRTTENSKCGKVLEV